MRERLDFRIPEDHARVWLAPDQGTLLTDSVRQVVAYADDPIVDVVRRAQADFQTRGTSFFLGWDLRREYSKAELDAAELFRVTLDFVYVAGEESGTVYDEFTSCPHCGAGAKQESQLKLNCGPLSTRKDFGRTMAFELLGTTRVAEAFERHGVTGVRFDPLTCVKKRAATERWKQVIIPAHGVRISPPTVVSNRPLEGPEEAARAGRHRCPRGDTLGLALISEAYVDRTSWDGTDVVMSNAYVGVRGGLLRPSRVIFASQKVRRVIESEKLRGARFEVAHLV